MNIGIDLGGSHIGVGIVDKNAKIIDKIEEDINENNKKDNNEKIEEEILSKIVKNVKSLLETNNLIINQIGKIGISCPGEPKNGCMKNIVNLNISLFPIVERLKKELNFENITIRNDAKCAGIAEKEYGNLKDVDDGIFLCIGTGIGGAAFLEGKMLMPKRNSGFEFGHMIIKKDGNKCKCGNKGCFETYCSMKKFKSDVANVLNINEADSRALLKKLKDMLENNIFDEKVSIIIEEYLESLLVGLANITNILEPEIIVIGGGFVYYKDILWNRLVEKFGYTNLLFNKETRPTLKLAKFENDAGIIGASVDRM